MKNLFFVICLITFVIIGSNNLFAISKVSNVTAVSGIGSWNDPNIWLPVGVPTGADSVTIKTGDTVNLVASVTLNNIANLTRTFIVETGATLNLNNFNLNVVCESFGALANGSIKLIIDGTINGGGTGNITAACEFFINIKGTGNISNLSAFNLKTCYSVIIDVSTNLNIQGNLNFYVTSSSGWFNESFGRLTVSNNISFLPSACGNPSRSSLFQNSPTGEFIVNNGNVSFSNSVDFAHSETYNAGKIELKNGNLSMKASQNEASHFFNGYHLTTNSLSPAILNINGDLLGYHEFTDIFVATLGENAAFLYNLDNSIINVSGALFPTGSGDDGYFDPSSFGNLVNYNGSRNQVIKQPVFSDWQTFSWGCDTTAYYHLQCSNGGTKTLESNIEIRGNLAINDTTRLDITVNTYSISLLGNWTNTSTNSNPFVERTGTVAMNGINSQTISIANTTNTETFYNLVLIKDSTSAGTFYRRDGFSIYYLPRITIPYYQVFAGIDKDTAVHLQSNIAVTNQFNLVKGGMYLNTHTLTISNPLNTGINRTHGFIKSETIPAEGYSFVDWKIGNSVGNYQFPFGKSGDQDYIPVTFNITSSGDASGSLSLATYNTAISNLPLPTGVTNVNRNGIDNSAYTADRFWIINSSYIIAPTLTFTLTATATELGSITNPQAQRWNYSTNLWEFPLPSQTYSITATSVSVSVPNFSVISSPWTIADNNHLLSAKPLVTHSPNVTICIGASTQLTANGINAVYYSWSPIASLTTLSLTPVATPTLASTFYHFGNDFGIAKVIATPTITTTYTLIISNNSGLDTSYITVTVPEPIVVIIQTPNTSICSGETYQILSKTNISTPAHYSWSPTTSLNNATVFNPIASPQTTTHYTLTITDDWGCYNTDSRLIHVEVQPTLVVSAPITICNGTSTILSAQVIGGTLQWIDGSTTNSILVQPTLTNQYSAFAQNSYCGAKQFIEVTVIDLPIVSAGTDQLMCLGAITGAILSGSSNSGSTYAWTPNNYLNNAIGSSTNANPSSIGIYNYTLTVTESHGCSNYDGVVVRVDTILIVNAGNDLTICSGITTSLNATITAGSTITWNPTTKLIFNPLTPNSPTLNSPTQQLINYSITVSAPGCNDETDYLTVQVLQSPQLVTNNVSICIGMIPTLTVSGADHYSWQPTEDTATVIFPQLVTTTNYTLIGTNNNGCMDTSIININVNNLPNVDAGNNITASTSLKLNLQGSGASVYLWSPSTSLDNKDISNPLITNRITQKYNLIGTDNSGCINTDSVYIKYITCDQIFVPDAFSPNGDDSNEMLEIIVEDSQCIKEMNFQIYDRWGNMVFETNDPSIKWDGKYHNQELTDAVFVYRIDITNVDSKDITQKGNLSLIR